MAEPRPGNEGAEGVAPTAAAVCFVDDGGSGGGEKDNERDEEEAKEREELEQDADGGGGGKDAAALLAEAGGGGGSSFISLDKLRELRAAFELADADGGGGLDLEEFITAFGGILGEGMSGQELTNLFMKVDANSDGSVDWGEFTEYMLLENRGSELMQKAAPKCEYLARETDSSEESVAARHSKSVTRLRFFKELGAYASCSEDGSVRLWQSHNHLKHLRTVLHRPEVPLAHHRRKGASAAVSASSGAEGGGPEAAAADGAREGGNNRGDEGQQSMCGSNSSNSSSNSSRPAKMDRSICPVRNKGMAAQAWTNDCCYMQASNTLAVATSDRTISFYDCSTGYDCIGRIRPMINSPLLLTYYCGPLTEGDELLVCADDGGYLHVWRLARNAWVFHDSAAHLELRAQLPEGVRSYFRHKVHSERINQLELDVSIGALISCSSDGTVALSDLEKSRVLRTFCGHGSKHVYSFCYIANVKLVASTGSDRQILFWNPYTMAIAHEITDRESIESPIVKVCFNAKEHQMVSLSSRSVVRVWDMSTFSCIGAVEGHGQVSASGKSASGRGGTAGALTEAYHEMLFDGRNQQLLLAGRSLCLKQAVTPAAAERKSHQWAVMDAKYNKNFHQLVSAAAFEVHVWDISSGQISFRFINPHGASSLTAMCFDLGGRRLLTGAHDGTIKIWNFNNGACLGDFSKTRGGEELANISDADNDKEVSSLACFSDGVQGNGYKVEHEYIVATGRDRRVFVFSESKQEFIEYAHTFPLPQQVALGHMDDINKVVHCGNSNVATAGDDGRILIWSLQSGVLKQRIGHSVTARKQLDKTPTTATAQTKGPAKAKAKAKAPLKQSAVELLLMQAKHFGESFETSATLDAREAESKDDGDEDDEDDEVVEADDDIARIRGLVTSTTVSDMHDVRSLRAQRAKDRNTPEKRLSWEELENAKRRQLSQADRADDAFEAVSKEEEARPQLSAREGKQKLEQAAELERLRAAAEKKRHMRGVPKPDRIAVENLLHLERVGCLCSSGSDGFVRLWNPDDGNLLIELDPEHAADESVVALATDEGTNRFLFTGDTDGWLSVWDISKVRPAPHTERDGFKVDKVRKWRAHSAGSLVNIVHLAWGAAAPLGPNPTPKELRRHRRDSMDLLVTTCTDGNVLLWTLTGAKIGMFGQEFPWSLALCQTWSAKAKSTMVVRAARDINSCVRAMHTLANDRKATSERVEAARNAETRRSHDDACNTVDSYKVLKTRMRNKFKLNYLSDIKESVKRLDEDIPVSADQLMLQQMSKGKRCKPSDMPAKPTIRAQMAKQQIMHRVALPALDPVQSKPILNRVRSAGNL